MKFLVLLILFPIVGQASDIDAALQGYIKQFQLKSLTKPESKNQALIRLGQLLFTNRTPSGNSNIACVECHHPGLKTTDFLPLSLGEGAQGIGPIKRLQKAGKVIARNAPALFNLGDVPVMFWDGRVSYNPLTKVFTTPVKFPEEISKVMTSALAAQAIFPLVTHEEMMGSVGSNPIASASSELEAWELIVEKLLKETFFQKAFAAAFPGEKINIGHVGEALAEFQKMAFAFSDTPYDRYLNGDVSAMTDLQKKGMDVFFNKGKCGECHTGEHLSSFGFQNVAVPQIGPGKQNGDDFGRFQWDPKPENLYAFRVPPLRNVGQTAPYMHTGAYKTLSEVIEHYDGVAESLEAYKLLSSWANYTNAIEDHDHRNDDVRISHLSTKLNKTLALTEYEKTSLLEFLKTGLSDVQLNRP